MEHKEALDLILANACPAYKENTLGQRYAEDGSTNSRSCDAPPDEVISVFLLDLHCATATVKARLISTVDSIQYEVLSVYIP